MESTIKSLALLVVILTHKPNVQNFLDVFIPFLATLIKKRSIKNLKDIQNLCMLFQDEYGLVIPHHPMVALINRFVFLGYGRETSPGEFSPNYDKIVTEDFSSDAADFDSKYKSLIEQFVQFAHEKYSTIITPEEASSYILLLLERHDLDFIGATNGDSSILPIIEKSEIGVNLAYNFARTLFLNEKPEFETIANVAFGHIIANTILISTSAPKIQNIHHVNYYLDTGILFGLTGINGEYEKKAFDQLIRMIKSNSSSIYVFNHTLDEFIKIINGCKFWVDSPDYDPNKANRALVYFRAEGYHKPEIDLFIARMPRILSNYGIQRVDIPNPNINTEYQMSDLDFQKKLIEIYKKDNDFFDEEEKEGTIYLDVKSVSAIHKLRNGCIPRTLNECGSIFITRNTTLAYASKVFEKNTDAIDYFYIPTTVTDVFIGTMIWLSNPISNDLQNISKSRLIANCYAALKPTRQIKKLFLAQVQKAEKDELLSGDDVTFLRTSNVAMELLQETTLGDKSRITNQTPLEIMNEIKAKAKKEARQELEAEKKRHEEHERVANLSLAEKDQELERKQQEIIDRSDDLNKEKKDKKALISKITIRVQNRANRIAWFLFCFFVIIILILQLIDSNVINLHVSKLILSGGKIFLLVISLLNLLANVNFLRIKQRFFNYLVNKELKSYGIEPQIDNAIVEENK